MVDAYHLLNNYKALGKAKNHESTGVSFAQNNKRNNNNKTITCYKCKQQGHKAPECQLNNSDNNNNIGNTNNNAQNSTNTSNTNVQSSSSESGMQLFNIQTEYCNFLGKDNLKNWILLDNQSTTDIFCNPAYLTNIHDSGEQMTVFTNGGSLTTTKKGTLNGYGKVWYHPDAMMNILSMSKVKKQFRVTYDSSKKDRFTI